MTTLNRLLESVFEGKRFESAHDPIPPEKIDKAIKQIPFTLSDAQKSSIFQAFSNDITYIQGPPGTGKSYTISALTILASKLGMKTLVASQKKPAVEIVYSKVSNLLGEEGCLFLTDDQNRKEATKDLLQNLLTLARQEISNKDLSNYQKLEKKIDDLLDERERYEERINYYNKEINAFFNLNEDTQRYQDNLKEVNEIKEDVLKKITKIDNEESRDRLLQYVDECRKIRRKSFETEGKVTAAQVLRLNFLVTTVLKNLNLDKEIYKNHGEEILETFIRYSREISKGINKQNLVKKFPIDKVRTSFDDLTNQLYPSKDLENCILSKFLKLSTNLSIRKLLEDKSYLNTLSDFRRRLHWRTPKKVKEFNKKIDFKKLFDLFPIVLGEMRTLHPYLPFKEELFDLVIVDEASQVNLAEVIPILFRAKRFCIVGDHKQLGIKAGGVIFLNKVTERLNWQKRFEDQNQANLTSASAKERDLLVSTSSILDLIRNENNTITSVPIVLNEHFRSMPMLADFTNNEFYKSDSEQSGLKIMTALPQNKCLNSFKNIEVKTPREDSDEDNPGDKVNPGEVKKVYSIMKSIITKKSNTDTEEVLNLPPLKDKQITLGVVSFMRDQSDRIREEAPLSFSKDELKSIDFMVGTPEDFQGNERDVMIIAPGVDETCSRSRGFMENDQRFNVASSRAKFYTFFIHGKLPNNMMRMKTMLNQMGIEVKDKKYQDGITPLGWNFLRSNCDSNFEHLVADQIEDFIAEKASDRLMLFNQVESCGYFLDFVVYDQLTKKSLAIEVDGKEHFYSDGFTHTDRHQERIMTLRRAGWKTHHLDYWNWFEDGWIDSESSAVQKLKKYLEKYFFK